MPSATAAGAASPKPILSKSTSHPYPFLIPARASSASHLPLVSAGKDDDDDEGNAEEEDEDVARERARAKANPRTRRRVSFDLNAVLHPAQHVLDDDDDEGSDEEGEGRRAGGGGAAPGRHSSLSSSSQPLATQSSPDLLTLAASSSSTTTASPSPPKPSFRQRFRLVSSPSTGAILPARGEASAGGGKSSKTARRLYPLAIRAPTPARAKVARRHALAQRHAAALELMLCGPGAAEGQVHHPPAAASPTQPAHVPTSIAESKAPAEPEQRPRPARRWSLFPRLHFASKAADSASSASTDADDNTISDADKSADPTETVTTADPETLPAEIPNSPSEPAPERTSTPESGPVSKLKRLPLLRRVSPSSGKEHPPSGPATPPALSPKQIRTLKAALMDMDLANGIIGELRARSLDPLNALLHPAVAAAEPVIGGTEAGAAPVAAPQQQPQPRCVLGPLLPPIEFALAAAASAASTSATPPSAVSPSLSSVSPFAGARSAHERGASGGGSRDDSALPDHLDSLREEDEDEEKANGPQTALAVSSTGTGQGHDGEHARSSTPVSLSTPTHPRSAARRSLAQILSKVRPKTAPGPKSEAGGFGVSVESEKKKTTAALNGTAVTIAAVAIAGAAAAATSGPSAAKAPTVTLSAASTSKVASATIAEEGEGEDKEDEDAVAPLGIAGALSNLPKPPTIMGMSPFSLAMSPRLTIATEMASTSGAFDALADLSAAALGPSPADNSGATPPTGIGFPTDRLSFVVHWWGYEVLLPPLAMAHLSTAQSVSSAFLSFLQTMAIGANLPELLPFIKYISMWVELEFRAIRDQDARGGGKGVVLAATWVMPMALVPRAWDYPVGIQPPPPPPPALGGAAPGSDGTAAPPTTTSSSSSSTPSRPGFTPGRNLRNRLDGPPVPAKDADEPALLMPGQSPRLPSMRPSFPGTLPPVPSSGAAGPAFPSVGPALLPIPVRF